MADAIFEHPRLATIYDALDGNRADLAIYVALADDLGARRIADLGCGTGSLAVLLARRGLDVVGIDPARASLDVARRKPDADNVRWLEGDASALPASDFDLITMTGNVAQAIVASERWESALRDCCAALRPGGHLAFETRRPDDRAWERWTSEQSRRVTEIPGVGAVENWLQVLTVEGPLVTFRWTFVLPSDGTTLTSGSTLRFRTPFEVETELAKAGFDVVDVRDAPDRPGREHVYLARRPT
jgi:SAM-dependent methyltransferase